MKEIVIFNNHFYLHKTGAIYWKEKNTLLLADLHLGKVGHFRKSGIPVPRKAGGVFYDKIIKLKSSINFSRRGFAALREGVSRIDTCAKTYRIGLPDNYPSRISPQTWGQSWL